ncbi:RAD51-associated protein 2 [Monodelphis domestica]|uniref:RAD51-associated protein 2 n=1 Tax=Monodelphis domestica TaxID=13616 RepID=UPI0024E1D78D|nr:RAD51-associated protein 2 [Monodelphis domestica]
MEVEPESAPGLPQAKRPRLGEDAFCRQVPEEPESSQPPCFQGPAPSSQPALPPLEEGAARGDEHSCSSQTPRGAPEQAGGGEGGGPQDPDAIKLAPALLSVQSEPGLPGVAAATTARGEGPAEEPQGFGPYCRGPPGPLRGALLAAEGGPRVSAAEGARGRPRARRPRGSHLLAPASRALLGGDSGAPPRGAAQPSSAPATSCSGVSADAGKGLVLGPETQVPASLRTLGALEKPWSRGARMAAPRGPWDLWGSPRNGPGPLPVQKSVARGCVGRARVGASVLLPFPGRLGGRAPVLAVLGLKPWPAGSAPVFLCLTEMPGWGFRELSKAAHSGPPKEASGARAVEPKKRAPPKEQGPPLLLTGVRASNCAFSPNQGRAKVSERTQPKGGHFASEAPGARHPVPREVAKHATPLRVVPRGTPWPARGPPEKVPPPSNHFGDAGSGSLARGDCGHAESAEKAIGAQTLEELQICPVPHVTPEKPVGTARRPPHVDSGARDRAMAKNEILRGFDFKGKFNCFVDFEPQTKWETYDPVAPAGPNNGTKSQGEFVRDFFSERREKIQDLFWTEKQPGRGSFTVIQSYQFFDNKAEREQKSNLLIMKGKSKVEDARGIDPIHFNQNSTTDSDERLTLLQEIVLANSRLFQSKNEPAELVDQRFNTDSTTGDNEHSADAPAQCLSTETETISDFEMKNKFDIVLRELCVFHEIGKEAETSANSGLGHSKEDSTKVNRTLRPDLATRTNECSPDTAAECLSTETKTISEFEMKNDFDIVLRELCVFHEIGKEKETSSIGESVKEEKDDFDKDNSMEEDVHQGINEESKMVSSGKIGASSLPCDTIPSINKPKKAQSSFKWKKIHEDGEQEVPHDYCSSSPSDDELFYSPSGEDFKKALSKNPALLSDAFMEGRIHSFLKGGSSLSHGIVRVHPLKTCRGPIRIGLSRKAKLKQLHPYLK